MKLEVTTLVERMQASAALDAARDEAEAARVANASLELKVADLEMAKQLVEEQAASNAAASMPQRPLKSEDKELSPVTASVGHRRQLSNESARLVAKLKPLPDHAVTPRAGQQPLPLAHVVEPFSAEQPGSQISVAKHSP